MLRRAFIALCNTLLLTVKSRAQKVSPHKLLVLDQSGLFGKPDFAFGSWLISNESNTRAELKKLQKSARYRRRLSYRSTDKYKKIFAQNVTKYILENAKNSARLVSFETSSQQSSSKFSDRYIKFLVQEIEAAVSGTDSFIIICQRRFSGDLDKKIRAKLIAQISGLKDVIYVKEREELLVQCLGQVTGSAHAFLNEKKSSELININRKPNKTKRQLKSFLTRTARLTFPWIPQRHGALLVTTRSEI